MARWRGLSDEQLLALLNSIEEDQSEGEYVDGISTDSDYNTKKVRRRARMNQRAVMNILINLRMCRVVKKVRNKKFLRSYIFVSSFIIAAIIIPCKLSLH